MLVTEAEAKKRWRRHLKKTRDGDVFGIEAPAVNRIDEDRLGARCIASECMAWTFDGFERHLTIDDEIELKVFNCDINEARGSRVGYCRAEPTEPKKERP